MPILQRNPDGSKHTHIFVRARKPDGSADSTKYRCDHPDCTYVAVKWDLVNKRSICARCRQMEITMTAENLKLAFPSCYKCSNSVSARKKRAAMERFSELNSIIAETEAKQEPSSEPSEERSEEI